MVGATDRLLTLQEFLALPKSDARWEYVAGRAVAKMAPKYHSIRLQRALEDLFEAWSIDRGRAEREWLTALVRAGENWAPLPDFSFVSFERLPREWNENAACPAIPELVVEVVSPGQSFGELAKKAEDYLAAGVDRVWIIDPVERTLTVFFGDLAPRTFADEQPIIDSLFPGLEFSVAALFGRAGLPGAPSS
ncbi:Uma2 family endonuclease [Gloeobacter kilaueensis]|uniref:Putative restriction endonuclease domain-containing protein n=1 Tax=Gloeobacter kilaueensis (strain ATCC BAA-2537 / CCAP 1431/1 / ULC 316 / JS1) TaxID=1183438 RepID=U5QEQ1_GLOK1|nr:Uma2 family endonuclease [Gloeobacter kilaueensis]AGY57386.1 hypothetical protein GKIL_1140 [Gloeobacter kilaueensis JS1]